MITGATAASAPYGRQRTRWRRRGRSHGRTTWGRGVTDVGVLPERILSLCSGAGGLDLGVHMALGGRARTVCYVEHEITAAAVLAARMEDGSLDAAPVWTDIHAFDGGPWRGRVEGVIGGFPCQPFSVAGKQRGEADPRHLWPRIAEIVRDVQPQWCFFENVRGHVRIGLRTVRSDLLRMGYSVHAGIFSAAEVGAPHQRERLFILAYSRHGDGCGTEWASWAESASRQELADCDGFGSRVEAGEQPAGQLAASPGRQELAYRDRGRREQSEEDQRRVQFIDPDSLAMAESARERIDGGRGAGSRRGAEPANGNSALADARFGQLPQPWWRPESRDGTGSTGSRDVADTIGERGCGRDAGWQNAVHADPPSPFPPGPGDLAGWQRVLAERPDLAPALAQPEIRSLADGVGPGMDLSRAAQLRIIGNGVVPQQAAYALRRLMEALT